MGYECLLNLEKQYDDAFQGATLILGNGSSIAYSPKFAYQSLYEKANKNKKFLKSLARKILSIF